MSGWKGTVREWGGGMSGWLSGEWWGRALRFGGCYEEGVGRSTNYKLPLSNRLCYCWKKQILIGGRRKEGVANTAMSQPITSKRSTRRCSRRSSKLQ